MLHEQHGKTAKWFQEKVWLQNILYRSCILVLGDGGGKLGQNGRT